MSRSAAATRLQENERLSSQAIRNCCLSRTGGVADAFTQLLFGVLASGIEAEEPPARELGAVDGAVDGRAAEVRLPLERAARAREQ